MVEEGALSKKWLWPGTVSEVHCNMFDRDVKTSNFWIFQGSEYAANYEYALVANVPGSSYDEKRLVLEQATLIFEIGIYLFFFFFQCFLKLLFHGISFLKIVCNVIIFPNTIYKYFSFRLTFHKPHPKFKPISKIWCITKSPVAHIIRSDWKKEYLKKSPYFYSV